jgi:acyl-CoA hydrolase
MAKGKAPGESAVSMSEFVLPTHANVLGNIFGGQIMSWIDIAAAIAAGKHARKICVTASIDALHFEAPVKIGQVVHIRAMVNYVGKTSMEVGVRVDAEDLITGETRRTARAYTTFVAVDEKGQPTAVPPLVPQSAEEKRRFAEAQARRESRIRLASEIKKSQA